MGKSMAEDELILWAESPEEARNFLNRVASSDAQIHVAQIFVAKRSPKSRSNLYRGGEYYRTTNDSAVDVYEELVEAPQSIRGLVQWCTCDIMLSRGDHATYFL